MATFLYLKDANMNTAQTIEYLKDVSQYEYNGTYYDLHNDYDCVNLLLDNSIFTLTFRKIDDNTIVTLNFTDVTLTKFIVPVVANDDAVTIDIIYRGRNSLFEKDEHGRAYFYIDFYDDKSIELWVNSIYLDS